ncbi:hypothetical protein HII36_11975 [Nonomuraea sp. NN258]|uniref:hypothetical protein n=1 Tax=Nonomuraea antri TaxID=2730852 RepID=UPI001569E1BF|nr:hypothetical protein [Nonomuraea antri]NRQ32551.1 hypothetical protein [Nonomuraea antri]
MSIKRATTLLVAGLVTVAGLGLTASTASADPGGAPCYGNTDGLFIKRKDNSWPNLWADVLNCGPARKVTLDVSRALDPSCVTIKRAQTARIHATGGVPGSTIRKAKYC